MNTTMINSLFPIQDSAIALMHDPRTELNLNKIRIVRFTGQGEIDRKISQWLGYEPSVEETAEIVRRIITNQIRFYGHATAEQPRNGYKGWIWDSALRMYWQYLPMSDSLYQDLLLCALVHSGSFHNDPVYSLVPKEHQRPNGETEGMQNIADYFLSIGIPETKLRRAWAAMLRLRANQDLKVGYVTCHWKDVTINGRDLAMEAQPTAHKLLLKLINPQFHAERKPTQMPRDYFNILDFVINQCNPAWLLSKTPAFERFLVHFLQEGFTGLPINMIEHYGKHFDLPFEEDTKNLQLLCGEAAAHCGTYFAYGRAYALAKISDNHEFTAFLEKARTWGQPITLNDEFKIID